MKGVIMIIGLIGVVKTVFAGVDESTLRQYKQEAQQATKGMTQVVEGIVSVDIERNQMKDVIGYQGTEVDGKGASIESAERAGSLLRDADRGGECTNKSCDVSSISSTNAILERDRKREEAGFIRGTEVEIIDNKGYLDKPRQIAREAPGKFDFLTGSYADCKADSKGRNIDTYEICDEYYDIKHGSCGINQVVEIDPRYNYECHKKREVKEKKCSDTLTKITCNQKEECSSGGIVISSMSGDVVWEQQGDVFIFGTIADNNWRGYCQIYDREARFDIKNKKLIKEFRLEEVGFDDYLQIKINDQQIYNGPYGGDTLEIKQFGLRLRVYNGLSDHNCELDNNWRRSPNIDLLPYLKEGENKIKIRVIVSGRGEFWMKIRAKQYCCTEWKEEREEICEYLG